MILDAFDDRYLGQKSADPTLDNDGNILLVGALYFNTVSNQMRVYSGTSWTDSLTLTAGSVSVLTNKIIEDISNRVGADHVHYKVRNNTGTAIARGTVVKAASSQPGTDYIAVEPTTSTSDVAIGIVEHTLDGTTELVGLAVNTGEIVDLDTSAWAVGTILYTAVGTFTATKPTTGKYQASAYVLRQHTTQGVLLVEFTSPTYIASTTQSGYVQLNNTLTSTSTVQALTAAQGKVLNDRLVTVENGTVQEGDSVTLTGDVTGTATFDSNGSVSVTATVVDDSHNHIISNVDGLQTALNGKQPIDATLTALAGLATAADKYVYATASDTFTTGIITSFGRSLVDDDNATTARTTLGISAANTPSTAVGGISATNVQGAINEISGYLNDLNSAVVHKTGNETVAGIKTFTSSPIVPTPTTDTQVANKSYVDSNTGGATWVANDARAKTALNASGTAPIYACRAWVNFNGTKTVAIRASGNVSSITDINAGTYTVNFTTAMPDVNYAAVFGLSDLAWGAIGRIGSVTANNITFDTPKNSGDGLGDPSIVNVSIFR